MQRLRITPGEDIETAICWAVDVATKRRCVVVFEFNGYQIVVYTSSSPFEVMALYRGLVKEDAQKQEVTPSD